MNLVCPACQNPINCANCQAKPTNPNSSVNYNKNNPNFTELEGILERNLGVKRDKNVKTFFLVN